MKILRVYYYAVTIVILIGAIALYLIQKHNAAMHHDGVSKVALTQEQRLQEQRFREEEHDRTLLPPLSQSPLRSKEFLREREAILSSKIISSSDFDRISKIEENFLYHYPATYGDAHFLIRIMNEHMGNGRADLPDRVLAGTALTFIEPPDPPQPLHDQILQVGISELPRNKAELNIGLMLLGPLFDKRVIPYVLPYANNSDKKVSSIAKAILKEFDIKSK